MAERAVLWGSDYPELGRIGLEAVGSDAAIAVSYGARPKRWKSLTPNEDTVAAVVGDRATLLVVADGHYGWESVPPAVNSVLEAFGDDPPPTNLSDLELLELFVAANEATLDANGGRDLSIKPSRTTLVVALITTERLQWASMGDSAIAVVIGGGATWLGDPKLRFVGYPMDQAAISHNLDRGLFDLDRGAWVAAVTDGFTDYAPRESRVMAGIASIATPAAAAKQLVEAAFVGGAGDNVGVAVTRVSG